VAFSQFPSPSLAYSVCTSSTRPPSPTEGMAIYETDTDRYLVYDGSNWNLPKSIAGPYVCTSSTRPSLGLFEGMMIYETDTDIVGYYNGSQWRRVNPNKRAFHKEPTGSRTTTSSSPVDWPTTEPCTGSFTKYASGSRLIVNVTASGFTSNVISFDYYIRIASTDYIIVNAFSNQISEHQMMSATREITGISAGVLTCTVRAAISGGITLTADNNDTISFTIEEVD